MEYLLGNLEAKLLEKEEAPSDELVFLINSRINPPVPVKKEDVYIRAMFLISDQVNSYGGCFPSDEHGNLASLLVDSPVLVGHTKDKLPIARNFKAELVRKDGVNWVKVWFYWLKESAGSLPLKENIDHGIYKECSIGFSFEFPECSVCGEDMRRCEHIPFQTYAGSDGKSAPAYFNYRKIQKVLETSLVYRGALPNTTITNDLIYQKHDCKDGICKLGRAYRGVVEGALKRAGLENRVKLVGEILERGYSDHDIDLICEPDLKGRVLASLPANYGGKIHFVEESESKTARISLFDFVPPTEPFKSDAACNVLFQPEDFSSLSGDWIVEPTYDGLRAQVHKQKEKIKVFDPQGNAIESKFPNLIEVLKGFAHQSFILDGEIVRYKGRSRLEYKDVISFVCKEDPIPDDLSFRYKLFDILELNGTDLTSEPLETRKKILKENFKETDFSHIVRFEKVTSDYLSNKIKELSTAQGAIIRKSDSVYFDPCAWFKWKREHELEALVTKVIKNKGGSYNYVCAVGSRSNPIPIGTTYSTNLKANAGDIIRVRLDHVSDNQGGYSWYAPRVKDIRQYKKEPDPIPLLERMMEKKKKPQRVEGKIRRGENKFVLQVRRRGEARLHDLEFSKRKREIGLTLLKLDLNGLDRGKRFLCEWKDPRDPMGLDFEGDIPASREEAKSGFSKDAPLDVEILDSGVYEMSDRKPDLISFRINGNVLSGIYLARKVMLNQKNKWLFWKKKESKDQE
jgi:hypothetical protein